jgi:hypothetical protein
MPGQPSGGGATCAHPRRRPTRTTHKTPTYYQGHRYHFFFIFFEEISIHLRDEPDVFSYCLHIYGYRDGAI